MPRITVHAAGPWPWEMTVEAVPNPFSAAYSDSMERLRQVALAVDADRVDVYAYEHGGCMVRVGPIELRCDRFGQSWRRSAYHGNVRAIALTAEALVTAQRYGVTVNETPASAPIFAGGIPQGT